MQIDIKIPKREIEIEGVRTGGVNTYTKEEIDQKDLETLNSAKAYTDAETYSKAQIDQKDADTLNSAKSYTDTTAQGVVNTLRGEIATKQDILTAGTNINISNNEISADLSNYYNKTEVDNKDTATLDSAKGYTDTKLTDYYTKTDTNTLLNAKQDTLTAGTNITIDANNVISATGGGGGTVDTAMSDSSTNAVQNRVIKSYIDTGLGTKQSTTTITTNTTDTDITLTVADNTEYRYTQELDSIDLTMPNGDFIASIVFESGSTATVMTYDSGIKWSGDDVVMGFFVPTADKTYNIVLWYDGININGISRGV